MATDLTRRLAAALAWLLALAAPASAGSKPAPSAPLPSLDSRVGWMDGACLAIKNADLAAGTALAVVVLSKPQVVRTAQIGARARGADLKTCGNRATINQDEGNAFYVVPGAVGPNEVAIGIVTPAVAPRVVAGIAHVDLDQNGHSASFTVCTSSEGFHYAIWPGKPHHGTPRWSAYEYLGYDVEPDCPKAH
jgi:hypothetical protein